MNKDKILANCIIIFISTLFVIGYFSIYKNMKLLDNKGDWQEHLLNIVEIDKEIDYQLDDKIISTNYDYLNSKILSVFWEIREFEKLYGFENFIYTQKNRQILADLSQLFKTKQSLIRQYQTIKSINNDLLFYLSSNILTTRNFAFNQSIYLNIIQNKVTLLNQKDQLQQIADMLEILGEQSRDYQFLTRANEIIKNVVKVEAINKQNADLKIQQKLNELDDAIQEYFANTIRNVLVPFFVCLVAMLWLLIRNLQVLSTNKTLNSKILAVRSFIEHSKNSIIIINKKGKILDVNPAFTATTKYTKKEVVGTYLQNLDKNVKGEYEALVQNINNNKFYHTDGIFTKTKNGVLYEAIDAVPTYDEFYQINGAIINKTNITKQQQIAKQLISKTKEYEEMIFIDNLTRLRNTAALTKQLNNGSNGIIAYIDVDNFNDLQFFYATNILNSIIISIARTLNLCLSTYQIKAELFFVDIGSFAIWHQDISIDSDIQTILNYFGSKNIKVSDEEGDNILQNITFTVGISTEQDTPNTNRLTQAILANHEAKRQGRKIVKYSNSNVTEKQYRINHLVSKLLQDALHQSRIVAECQPIFDVSGKENKIASYEVLMRILDKDGNIHYPAEFLRISKIVGLYPFLTEAMINNTFELIQNYPNDRFSINLSSVDMSNENIYNLFVNNLKQCMNPNNITVEILESEDVDDWNIVNQFFSTIKQYGCRIAIDDFGSAYSNIYRILEINADYLKIDGSIVQKLATDETAYGIVETLVLFAKQQNIEVVAEFVSNEEILEKVQQIKIKYAQGFLLGKPAPIQLYMK